MQISNSLAGLYSLHSLVPKTSSPIAQSAIPSAAASQPAQPAPAQSSTQATGSTNDASAQAFLDYMKKPLAQKLEDAWLAKHNLTRKDLEAMTPEKRQAIEKQMADEIKAQTKQAMDNKLRGKTDILV
jgi:hypothetical protein